MTFKLDPQLENDSIFIADLALCELRLINDRQYPWCILVPKREQVFDLTDLQASDYALFFEESFRLTQAMKSIFSPDKMNIAALGNVVKQLHVHHIARFTADIAWPAPIWGFSKMQAYDKEQAELIKQQLLDKLT